MEVEMEQHETLKVLSNGHQWMPSETMGKYAVMSDQELSCNEAEIGVNFPSSVKAFQKFDWDNSALGNVAGWSEEVRTSVSTIQQSAFPTTLYLGAESHLMCWNDAFAAAVFPIKHPTSMGKPSLEVLPELDKMVTEVFKSKQSLTMRKVRIEIESSDLPGFKREGFFDFIMGPIFDKKGECSATWCLCNQLTQQVLLQRRMELMGVLGTQWAHGESVDEVCRAFISTTKDSMDIPWMSIYVENNPVYRDVKDITEDLIGSNSVKKPKNVHNSYKLVSPNIDPNEKEVNDSLSPMFSLPSHIAFNSTLRIPSEQGGQTSTSVLSSPLLSSANDVTSFSDKSPWPFAELSSEKTYLVVSTPTADNPYGQCIIMAITSADAGTGQIHVLGIMVASVCRFARFDVEYLNFFLAVGKQLESALINGNGRERDRKTAEALFKLNYERIQFFQNTAHELRTPLTLMLGPLEELISDHDAAVALIREAEDVTPIALVPPISKTLSRLSLVRRNARRLLKLVNSILRFSSIEAGKLETRFSKQPKFAKMTRELIECFIPLSTQTGVELRLEKGLARSDGRTNFDLNSEAQIRQDVYVDADLWEQIIFNLISNAFKHTWTGSITCSLYDSNEDGIDGLMFEVGDTGVGIAENHQSSVFDRFYRADSSGSRSSEGTGIGLSLVKELVRLHGGTVRVKSEIGVGSRFYVWLPRGSSHLQQARVFEPDLPGHVAAANMTVGADHDFPQLADITRIPVASSPTKNKNRIDSLVLEPLDVWINAPASENRGHPLNSASPTPTAGPQTYSDSYFPEQPKPMLTTQLSDGSVTSSSASSTSTSSNGLKRKLGQRKNNGGRVAVKKEIQQDSWMTMSRKDSVSSLASLSATDPSDRTVILLVDDNSDMRLWISSILRTEHLIVQARNGQEAMDIMQTEIPDLVLSDVMMPLMDGLSLVRHIRRTPRLAQIPVLLLSARSGQDDIQDGLDAGAADYLTKPFNVKDLVARCRVHTRLNRLRLKTAAYENELIRAQAKTDAKNNLLSLVSHELRTPLSTVVQSVDLLKHQHAGSGELLETLSTGAELLRMRIDQLLDVAQMDSNAYVMCRQPFDLDTVLSKSLSHHAEVAAKKGIEIFAVVGHAPSKMISDSERLTQVLEALMSNAIKFSDKDDIIVLRIWLENENGEELDDYDDRELHLCFAVTDEGPGMSPTLASKIFQPFQMGDGTSTRSHGGAGLGLALAERVVEMAGGQIGVESTEGKGSTFRCRWPVRLLDALSPEDNGTTESTIAIVTDRQILSDCIACTADTCDWDLSGQQINFDQALTTLELHKGLKPLIFFIDAKMVLNDPQGANSFRHQVAQYHQSLSPSVMTGGKARVYTIVTLLPSESRAVPDIEYDGVISSPYYRSQVISAVSDVLNKRRRPSFDRKVDLTEVLPREGDPFPRGRLLVAEDNKINAKLLVKQLRTLGYAADEAEHGLKVLDLIQSCDNLPHQNAGTTCCSSYRGILMDLDMPSMDGFEATRRVRSMGGQYTSLPILAVTANASTGDREKCIGAGMDDFLPKPVSIVQLTALLKRNGLYNVHPRTHTVT